MGPYQMVAGVSQIKRGDLRTILPMIAQKARVAFARLPFSEQTVTSVPDLMAEGKLLLYNRALPTWTPNLGLFSTYFFVVLDNYYTDRVREASAAKRSFKPVQLSQEIKVRGVSEKVTMETFLDMLSGAGYVINEIGEREAKKDRVENRLIRRIDAERAFLKAYRIASLSMRKYLIRWLLQPHDTKFKDGVEYQMATREFRTKLTQTLTEQVCRTIHTDQRCRENIVAGVFAQNFATPLKPDAPSPTTLQTSREAELVPLLPMLQAASLQPCAKVPYASTRIAARMSLVPKAVQYASGRRQRVLH